MKKLPGAPTHIGGAFFDPETIVWTDKGACLGDGYIIDKNLSCQDRGLSFLPRGVKTSFNEEEIESLFWGCHENNPIFVFHIVERTGKKYKFCFLLTGNMVRPLHES